MGLGEKLMKVVVKVRDVVSLAKHFEESPKEAMQEVVAEMQLGFKSTLEKIMDAEIALFLGSDNGTGNKRNGYTTRTFAVKGLGAIEVRVPRDRKGRFVSKVIPPSRRYEEAIEKDLALLNLAGLSTRMLSLLSSSLLGVKVSPQEVSNSMHKILPAAKVCLEERLRSVLQSAPYRYPHQNRPEHRFPSCHLSREATRIDGHPLFSTVDLKQHGSSCYH